LLLDETFRPRINLIGKDRTMTPIDLDFPPELWPGDPDVPVESPLTWVWQGFLTPAHITLLTAQWKLGKTTLLAVLLSRLKTGGTLAGRAVAPGKALVVSEEARAHWQRRHQRLDFGRSLCLLCQPFRRKPTRDQWLALISHIVALHEKHGFSLVVIDTISSFLPSGCENSSTATKEALLPLGELTARGVAVLLLHHPRKGRTLAGQAARGTGALNAHADIDIEMHSVRPASDPDRRRRLFAASRFDETPRELTIALNPDGADYDVAQADETDNDFNVAWPVLRQVLQTARTKLSRRMIFRQWPVGHDKPSKSALHAWLQRAHSRALVHRDGAGHRNSPFYYCLPERLDEWKDLPPMFQDQPELYDLHLSIMDAGPKAKQEQAG
jgi:hypothetical protein